MRWSIEPPSHVCHGPPTRLTRPALAMLSPSPLRPTAIAKWPARTGAACPRVNGVRASASARRNKARSVDESMPTSVAARLAPPAPTSVSAAGVRRKTCAAVTTSPVRQTEPEAIAPRRPRTATVPAPRVSTIPAIRSEWARSASVAVESAVLMKKVSSGNASKVRRRHLQRIRRTAEPSRSTGVAGSALQELARRSSRRRRPGLAVDAACCRFVASRRRRRMRSLELRSLTGGTMLEARGLFKSYGDRAVVADLSLDVGAGEIVGLLGPNGAGKSTTVAMLCGLVGADRGEVFIGRGASRLALDEDAHAAKRRIGVVPQELSIYENLGAAANLELFGALYGLSGALLRQRVDAALALVGLADRARDKPQSFSGGMKRRLNIAAALVHDPDV